MLCSLATKLEQGQIEEISSLEKELGVPILAFACHQMDAAPHGRRPGRPAQGAGGPAGRRPGRGRSGREGRCLSLP